MKTDNYQEYILDCVERAIQSPESITDEERKAWMHDPDFMQAFEAALEMRRAMNGLHEDKDAARQAFRQFAANHQQAEVVEMPAWRRGWWKVGAIAVAACLAGWLLLPTAREIQKGNELANVIYQASRTQDAIELAMQGDTVKLEEKTEPQQLAMKNIIVNGDTIIYQPLDLSKYQITQSTVTVPQGHTVMIVLADGTKVWLNTQSSLIHPNSFAKDGPRQVELRGEAYFEVAPDVRRPFIVKCGKMETQVLGTSFNIRNYPESAPCVTLASGSVRVSGGGRQVVLKPDQQATLQGKGQLRVTEADVENITSWRNGQFYFEGATLREVLVEMGRWYNMDVVFRDSTHFSDRLHFSGDRQWKISEIVEALNIICDVKITIENGALVLY